MKIGFAKPGSYFTSDGFKFVAGELQQQRFHPNRHEQVWDCPECSVSIAQCEGSIPGTAFWAYRDKSDGHHSNAISRDKIALRAIGRHNMNKQRARAFLEIYAPDMLAKEFAQ